MKQKVLTLLLSAFCACLYAQMPVAKVDINMEGRSEAEVNEPGYTPWNLKRVNSESLTVSDVTFTLTATGPTAISTFRTSWDKKLVQSPYFMRLVNDGLAVDNDTLLKYPGVPAAAELRISGLPVGMNIIQTYHNVWSDTAKTEYAPFNVYLNGNQVHSKVKYSGKVQSVAAATCLLTEMNVTQAGEEMVLRFEATTDFTPATGKSANYNIYINGFELNVENISKQAHTPVPTDRDIHVDADNGSFTLQWQPSLDGSTVSHTLYLGTDSIAVDNAANSADTNYKGTFPLSTLEYNVDNLYSMNTYYWRVDQTDAEGTVTKGKVWVFKPRQLAFKDAEGYGRFATGGRGGRVVYVTNLNDDGPGSFRAAATDGLGPRTIMFNVSGIIYLNSRLVIDPFVSVAGQTAPGKGICFRAAPVGVGKESICRFVRTRLGAGTTYDGMGMAGNDHSIMDHCSISWGIDECFSSRNARNITLQRTLISEALNVAGHSNYPAGKAHGFAGSVGGDVASLHHNLLAHCSGRNWSMAGGLDGAGYYSGRLDIFNMVVYNWDGRTTDGGAHEVNFVNNYYKAGPASSNMTMLTAQLEGTGKGSQSYYVKGNIFQNANGSIRCDGTNDDCGRTYQKSSNQVLDWTLWVDEPFFPSHATIHTANDAYKTVLSDVGCTMPVFDDHDKRIIQETLNGTYTYSGSYTGKPGLIDHQDDAGGYENYPEETRPADFDSDMDGLPDWWEKLHGTNPNSASGDFSDANTDTNKDGFTYMDEYLEWMSTPHYYITSNESSTIEVAPLTSGYTNNPSFSIINAENMNAIFNGSSITVTPGENAKGINYLKFQVVDAEGSTMIRTIGICVDSEFPNSIDKITSEKNNPVSIYPNPFDSQMNITIGSESDRSVTINLEDIIGRTILSKSYNLQAGDNTLQLDCPVNIPKQLYFLKVTDVQTGKIIGTAKAIKN